MTAATPTPPPPPSPELAARQPPPSSRWAPWIPRALRWAAGLLTVFALGLVATWMVRVLPLRQQIARLEEERASLQASLADLQAEVARLQDVDAENEALRATKAELEVYAALLAARIGTSQAQLILAAGGERDLAVSALSNADEQLATLERVLEATQRESIRALRYRLAMVVEEIGSDTYAAQRDLEVLANGLEMLEKEMSTG